MKIAVLSNLWPPKFRGGYELGAAQVVEELRKRGHEVQVWAAHEYHLVPAGKKYQWVGHAPDERAALVDVGLCVFGSLLRYLWRRKWGVVKDLAGAAGARRRYRQALRVFQPDCLLAFNPCGILAPVLDDFAAYAEKTGVPLNCYVSDHWLEAWPIGHPVGAGLIKSRRLLHRGLQGIVDMLDPFLRRVGLAPEPTPRVDRYFYCSDFIRRISRKNAGAADNRVAHWGVADLQDHGVPAEHFQLGEPLTLVYAGQLIEHKGLHVLIEALARCRVKHSLVVIGDEGVEYATGCKQLAKRLGVLEQIRFAGKKRPSEMLPLIAESGQVLVVPSVWEEPFSIVVLEGMGLGLPVIAANTGGTPEVIKDGENGFLFSSGSSDELATIIDHLEADRELCRRVGERAHQCVLREYRIEGLVDRLESSLEGVSNPCSPLLCAAGPQGLEIAS
jgi:glycogen synthase